MTIRFQCPAGHRLRASDDRVGRKVRCPRCEQAVEVPQPAEQTPAATVPSPVDVRRSKRPPALPLKPKAKPPASRPAEPVSMPVPLPAPEPVEAAVRVPAKSARQSSLPPASLPPVVPVDVPSPEPVLPVEPVEALPEVPAPTPVEKPQPAQSSSDRWSSDSSVLEPLQPKTPVEKEPGKTESRREPSRHVGRRDRKRRKRPSAPAIESAITESSATAAKPDREPPQPPPPPQPQPRQPSARQPSARQPSARRRRAQPKQQTMPSDVYVPDAGHVAAVRWLAVFLGLAVAFSLCPVVYKWQLNLATAEWWGRIALLLAIVQVAFIVWMVNRPDWASVWVVMLVFAAVATLYGMCTAIALATPVHKPILLGMADVREPAKTWCGAVLLVMSLVTYLSGRASAKWRRTLELERATAQRIRS